MAGTAHKETEIFENVSIRRAVLTPAEQPFVFNVKLPFPFGNQTALID